MLPEETRQVYAVTYGEPPDPPATAAVVAILDRLAGVLATTKDDDYASA